MASTGTAPALSQKRAIIGPASTQGGFQYWYLACLPDSVVAVRQSMGAFFPLSFANGVALPPMFSVLGALIRRHAERWVKSFRERTETSLQRASLNQLRGKGNIVHQVTQLKSITFNGKSFGNIVLPNITFESKTGRKQKYAIQLPDFEKACVVLKQMYPDFCR